MQEDKAVCVGLDTHKAKIAVAVAEPGRSGEVRFQGEVANEPEAVRRLLERLANQHGRLEIVSEAGTNCVIRRNRASKLALGDFEKARFHGRLPSCRMTSSRETVSISPRS